MPGWNLALRLGLEATALIGYGLAAWAMTAGAVRWVAVFGVPLVAAGAWGVFNVIDDPSRSGAAPIEVAGWLRLVIELVILCGGAVALGLAAGRVFGLGLAVLIAVQYATSWSRVRWLAAD